MQGSIKFTTPYIIYGGNPIFDIMFYFPLTSEEITTPYEKYSPTIISHFLKCQKNVYVTNNVKNVTKHFVIHLLIITIIFFFYFILTE